VTRLERLGTIAPASPDRVLLGVPAALLLAALVWRDSETLVALDGAALVLLAALTVPDAQGRPLVLSGPAAYLERMARAAFGWTLGAIPLGWATVSVMALPGRWRSLAAAGLGVAAVSPALLVFAALLSSADPAFGRVLESLFAIDLGPLLPHLFGLLLATWFAGGLLWAAARRPEPGTAVLTITRSGRVGATTLAGALGAIEALFAIFVVMQARYLFGGYAHVLGVEGMTVAEYARRGFFELVAVAGLTLPILLLADWALDARRPEDRIRLRWHVLGLVGLLLLLLASALSRMLLYTREFGLTESRVYVTACMGWLACVFAWFVLVQLRGTPERFATGAFAAAIQVLLVLNLMDVDGMIVRVNAARVPDGRPFDAAYVTGLGAGAVPQLLRVADRLPAVERCAVLREAEARWAAEAAGSGTRWNVERARATGPLLERLARRTREACDVRASARRPTPRG
ncbi:MAG TPA: DUF4173 domain-containing protein, partial [Gemmatimonadales bacterium]|nr:DUF4173 domain-containing protein [Gemmatimonadales bacterium]